MFRIKRTKCDNYLLVLEVLWVYAKDATKIKMKFLFKILHSRNQRTQKTCKMLKYVLEVADVKSFSSVFNI